MIHLGKRFASITVVSLVLLALWDQLVRDPAFRDWHGRVFGVPYDFRIPTTSRLGVVLWSPENPQIISPHVFGLGWAPNIGRLYIVISARLRTVIDGDSP